MDLTPTQEKLMELARRLAAAWRTLEEKETFETAYWNVPLDSLANGPWFALAQAAYHLMLGAEPMSRDTDGIATWLLNGVEHPEGQIVPIPAQFAQTAVEWAIVRPQETLLMFGSESGVFAIQRKSHPRNATAVFGLCAGTYKDCNSPKFLADEQARGAQLIPGTAGKRLQSITLYPDSIQFVCGTTTITMSTAGVQVNFDPKTAPDLEPGSQAVQ